MPTVGIQNERTNGEKVVKCRKSPQCLTRTLSFSGLIAIILNIAVKISIQRHIMKSTGLANASERIIQG